MSKSLIIGKSESAVYYDCDGTLVQHTVKEDMESMEIVCPYTNEVTYVKPIAAHIKLLKRDAAIGKTIVVWSHAGTKWAESVVKQLKLSKYVTAILPKLTVYVDDYEFGKKNMELIRIFISNGWGK